VSPRMCVCGGGMQIEKPQCIEIRKNGQLSLHNRGSWKGLRNVPRWEQ
jgi:hypothetical protein